MTARQYRNLREHLQTVYMYQCWPIAQLEAAVRNMMGGKPDADAKPDAKPIKPYHTVELLPWFARPTGLESMSIPTEAAREFLRHLKDVPGWVLEIAPLEEIKNAAG